MSLWFCSNEHLPNAALFSNRTSGSHGNFFCIRYALGRIICELDENDKNYVVLKSTRQLDNDEWHHVVTRRKDLVTELFIDGKLDCTQHLYSDNPTNIRGLAPVGVASSPCARRYNLFFGGYLCGLFVYHRWLDDEEVRLLYSSR